MRLGVDARVLVHRPTGVARYLRGLLAEWPRFKRSGDELILFVDREPTESIPGSPDRVVVARTSLPGGDPIWRQWRLPRALRRTPVDLLFCPFYSAPLRARVKTVVTIHDASFAAHPEWFRWKSRLAFSLAGPSARRAQRVLTVSQFSAREIVTHLGVPAEHLAVIPPGIDRRMLQPVSAEELSAARRWLGADGPYLLHLGAVHQRRHVDITVRALSRVAPHRRELKLVIAGPTIQPAPDLERLINDELRLRTRVIRREWIPEEHVRGLVAGATALVYLSSYEGFGLPCLEALAAGCPVLALRSSALPETLGDAALWVESPQPDAVAKGIDRLIDDAGLRHDLTARGRTRAQRFSPEEAAERTFDLLRSLAR